MPLIRLEVSPSRISLRYRAVVSGSRTFYIHPHMSHVMVGINDQAFGVEQSENQVIVPAQFERDQVVWIEVTAGT